MTPVSNAQARREDFLRSTASTTTDDIPQAIKIATTKFASLLCDAIGALSIALEEAVSGPSDVGLLDGMVVEHLQLARNKLHDANALRLQTADVISRTTRLRNELAR